MSAESIKELAIPELCLVVLVGVSGSGKSSFARKHFLPTQVLSSDECRGWVSDDPNDQKATGDAFDVLFYIAKKRLAAGRLTVVDATNVQSADRKRLVAMAREQDCLAVAVVLDTPPKIAVARNEAREDRNFGARVIRSQHSQLRRGLRSIKYEGFSRVHLLSSVEQIDQVRFSLQKLWTDKREDKGPFDIIGDIHGCYRELCDLLEKLGYQLQGSATEPQVIAPEGRRAIFLGDLVDRGPDSPAVLRLVMSMVAAGSALCVPGNHEVKLFKQLSGKKVRLTHGLERTVEQFVGESADFGPQVAAFIKGLISHYVLDEGRLVVCHAGLRESYQGRASARVRAFCLYGETTGETDGFGLPVRYDWVSEYRGRAAVVYGHTPMARAEWNNNTLCLDTGCVFGGKLSALRYPERELVQVDAHEVYYASARPQELEGEAPSPRSLPDISDVYGKNIIDTRVRHSVTVSERHSAAALEAMSRFAIDPRWLIYLPPTMSPPQTAPSDVPLLERPEEVLEYFSEQGVEKVVAQEKHMGSRAVVVLARSVKAAQARFGVGDGKQGVVYTRRGRAFFNNDSLEQELIFHLAKAIERAGLWEELQTDWLCLDCELMPWSFKAIDLLRSQYAAVGCSAQVALAEAISSLASAQERGSGELLARFEARQQAVQGFSAAWRQYCWTATELSELKLAPFHLLASQGRSYFDKSHLWHMQTLARLAQDDPLLIATNYQLVDLQDQSARQSCIQWWQAMTRAGGEGMVVKPEQWIVKGKRGLCQPAIKCRGPEYLRIIYGPEYNSPENLERLRERGLSTKRSLALREFALGLEGLYRFVEEEALWRVHECVFGVLALESEPVDPRL